MRLTPRASEDRIDGVLRLSDGKSVLAARVRALPEDGAANAALCAMTARALGLPKSAVSIASGGTARLKTLRLDADPVRLGPLLQRLAGRA